MSSGLESAQRRFREAGLAFPKIPVDLAIELLEAGDWCWSTREVKRSPYEYDFYVKEATRAKPPRDYAIVAHAGHGVNSYALHYYLAHGPLRMLLQLAWGGVYQKEDSCRDAIRSAFEQANRIVALVARLLTEGRYQTDELILVAQSDFYGNLWKVPGGPGGPKGPGPGGSWEVPQGKSALGMVEGLLGAIYRPLH